ncbi:ATP-binding protein [Actinocrinis puniceicyclus]|uniref:ATP-binding protein n=1 Tax=Actinocrinis puniceicyclus TaxID=977794 RepID=A0A8J7WPG2_9ACTN|nr:ATP-binding protein [Actinocrinis puniceicyclus]MBS2963150.1 ATP-binding protein [Actinocrinis puniceicyclus]
MEGSPLIESLRKAVDAAPQDVPLRLHLAGLLLDAGCGAEAISHLGLVLAADPTCTEALDLMQRAVSGGGAIRPAAAAAACSPGPAAPAPQAQRAGEPDLEAFDWEAAARDLGEALPPMFLDGDDEQLTEPAFDVEAVSTVRLDDVGGMAEVKKRLEAAFLAPLRNPELRRLYGKSLKGGLLLYGPPGCGKTFIARAIAGELGAAFFSVTLADVLDMYIGQSERNLSEIFATARRHAPCVLFLDEVDAIGQRRSQLRSNSLRGTVNQLLSELDGVGAQNDGVFVLAATNAPWDVDVALRRPGRLDRTVLVLPPDQCAREAILRHHLKGRPVAKIDLAAAAKRTEGYSGADLAHVCETAAERALLDSAVSGTVRMIEMRDVEAALHEVRPSAGPWLESARNVALFANEAGAYDDLLDYLKKRKLL